jgi:DNA polymerase elongation subunit (family B)
MNPLISGKDNTQRIVGIEPGNDDTCVLFIQNESGKVGTKEVPMTHWMIYTKKRSSKMKELKGNQHYKWLMEYNDVFKFREIKQASYQKKYEMYVCRDPKEAFMLKNGMTYYKGMNPNDVAVLSFDTEHTFGIGKTLNKKGKLLLISNTFRDSKGKVKKKLFAYDDFQSEADMIKAWCDWVRLCDPSILLGHNIFGHDFKILRFASHRGGVKLRLGRDKSELKFDFRKSLFRKDGSQKYDYLNVNCYGREIIDTFFLSMKYDINRKYESYRLKTIIAHEKLEREGRVFVDAEEIVRRYKESEFWKQLKGYAIDDADDPIKLFDLMIPAYFYTAYDIPRSFQQIINTASGSQINSMMIRSYLQKGHSIAKADEKIKYEGAISFGVKGIHNNVFKIDIKSQYPSIILQYGIENKTKDPWGHFLKMVLHYYNARIEYKRLHKETGNRYYKDLDAAAKIFLNSMYGFLAAILNYNYMRGAETITAYGRKFLIDAVEYFTGQQYDPVSLGLEVKIGTDSEVEDVA